MFHQDHFLSLREIGNGFLHLVGMVICVRSPCRQSDGDNLILQPKIVASVLATDVQNEWTGQQAHVVVMSLFVLYY